MTDDAADAARDGAPAGEVVHTDIVFPSQTNHYGTLFGGEALKLMDKVAFIAATRVARTTVVTVSLDRTDFHHPVRQGDIVEVRGRVVARGRSSITVETKLYSENLLTGARVLSSTGRFVMVAVDDAGRPKR